MTPAELSDQLRNATGAIMTCRRWIVGLSLICAALLGFITLYQVGILRRLPDPPLPRIDSNRVDAADAAYAKLRMPDGLLGLLSYAVTASLAAVGGKDRHERLWWLVLLLAAKVLFDAYNSVKLTFFSWHHYRAFCVYCLIAMALTLAMLPLVIPETWSAVRAWFK